MPRRIIVIFIILQSFECIFIQTPSNDLVEEINSIEDDRIPSISREKRQTSNKIDTPTSTDFDCTLPDGKPGQCKQFFACPREEFKQDNTVLLQYLCVREKSAVGVCCPSELSSLSQKLAGDLPTIASADESENALTLRLESAANRGCGMSTSPHKRVIGASQAKPSEWPWMAFVAPEGFVQHCGGVLITDRHVLTAAHCTQRYKAEELFVRLGEYDYNRDNDSRTYVFQVSEKRQHHFYQHSNHDNDIAILKFTKAAAFNTYVWPICLPPLGLDLTNKSAVATGWGSLFYGGPNSNVLMEVSVPIWDTEKCKQAHNERITDNNLCAAAFEGGRDTCQGDSGGPLMYQMASGRWTVVGLVSWGIRCGEPNHPGVYTRVDKYLMWIMQNAVF